MISDEYVAKIAEHLKKHAESRELEMKEDLRKAEVCKNKAPHIWQDVKASLFNAVERITKISPSLQLYDRSYGELILALAVGTNKHFRDMSISFDSSSGNINYFLGERNGRFEPTIVGDNVFYQDATIDWENALVRSEVRLPMRADDIAKKLVDIICDNKS